MNLPDKIVRGDNFRKTRLHDEKGNFMDLQSSRSNIPKAILTFLFLKIFNHRPCLPWFPYNAIKQIEQIIRSNWKIIEFGSGMSTVWLANKCGFLHSIEHNENWYMRLSNTLENKKLTNVKYELRGIDAYSDLSGYKDGFFDFCIVDGINRLSCVENVIPKIRSGGFIYLDDSDVHRDPERRKAEEIIIEASVNGSVEYFVDFSPTQIHAKEGMLGKL